MPVAEVYRVFWRHKLFIVAMTVVAVGAAWYLTGREQRLYTTSTLVRVQQQIRNPTEAYGALQTGGRLAQTYAEIAATRTISLRVYKELGGRIPYSGIAGAISGAQVRDLELLAISVQSPNPHWAAAIANATPAALRSFITETGTARDQVITIEEAGVPRNPSSPNKKLNIAIALLLGLAFNCGLALLIEFVRDRVHEPTELERLTRKPVLATIPNLALSSATQLRTGERSTLARLRSRVTPRG